MALTAEQIDIYGRDGYLRVPNVFSDTEVDNIRRLIYRLYQKFQPDDDELNNLAAPWNDLRFDRKMIELRARDPKMFGALYDCAQGSVEISHFVTNRKIVEIAADCLGEDADALGYSGIMFRMDPPRDQRNALNWHQDRAYYPQNENGDHGLVTTIALQDIKTDTGALMICPGSQREGFVPAVMQSKTDYETTEQRGIPAHLIERYPQIPAEMSKGDLTLMNMNVFHRSGNNSGNNIRYSALCRFHRIMADDYVPFGLLYQFNKFLSDRIWKAQKSY
jgi:hypothetical protein